jgi:hyperosmotically inducible protein
MRKLLLTFVMAATVAVAANKPKSDDQIRDNVMVKLANDPDVKGAALDVESKDGVVTIKGRVPNQRAKDKAPRVAKKVKGVKSVDNQITVSPT